MKACKDGTGQQCTRFTKMGQARGLEVQLSPVKMIPVNGWSHCKTRTGQCHAPNVFGTVDMEKVS